MVLPGREGVPALPVPVAGPCGMQGLLGTHSKYRGAGGSSGVVLV